MSSKKKIFPVYMINDDLPPEMQTKALGDITKPLFFVKPTITNISVKARKYILDLNVTDPRSRKKMDISQSADFGIDYF